MGFKVTLIGDGDCLVLSTLFLSWINCLLGNATCGR